ncbi:hypothetical protein HIM_11882 [Hirsutella minnesotensis 3608]|uniref:HTH CENPB-type domain-containing protein n=1 Tax=Hirsutella minnesotensis 3608 TaxID=1043627 RepID=A0A0F7ZIN4_9HYPO|nr:hypothetical protein HIM_11882 [Hirsutella minnesotensis 3608]
MAYTESELKAARAVLQSRDTLNQRPRRVAARAATKPLSIRAAAALFNVGRNKVHRAIKAIQNPPAPRGRRPIFNDEEDEALVAYVDWMQKGGFPATKPQLEAAANALRRRRDPQAPPVSRMWYSRWLRDHPQFRSSYVKAVERARKSFQSTKTEAVERFFGKLGKIVSRYNIGASECWNEDECGVRIGSLRERILVLVTRTTRHQRPEAIEPGDRESCTVVAAVNAAGEAMPPWIVFKVFPSESWAEVEASGDIRFARSDTGFSNAEIPETPCRRRQRPYGRPRWSH